MKDLKRKKYLLLTGIVLLVTFLIGIIFATQFDKYKGLVSVKNVNVNTRVLSSVSYAESNTARGYDEIKYDINFTLNEVDGVLYRNAIVKATLSDEEFRYAKFKLVNGENTSSKLIDEGKSIEVKITNVPLGIEQELTLSISIENAPDGFVVKPTIDVKEETGSFRRGITESTTVSTTSLTGKVTDEKGNGISDIELSINDGSIEKKRTYSDSEGNYVFSDLESGNYKVNVEEDNYKMISDGNVSVDSSTNLDVVVRKVKPYTIETHKYIKSLKLIVNGKEENYSYKDAEKVVQNIKNAKTISGEIEYKIVVKNTGEIDGKVERLIDEPSEGLSFNEEKNHGWVNNDGVLLYNPIVGSTLKSNETKEVKLVLDIENTKEIKTYLNKLTAKGEVYEKVVYVINGETYKEETVLEGDILKRPSVDLENFDGWYTDKNYTNKYKFNNSVNKNLILYGYTLDSTCSVTFMDLGEIYDVQEVTCGNKVTKPTNPSHEGYEFKKWLNELNDEYDFNTSVDSDIVLTSSNSLINYSITYNLKDGALETGKTNPSVYTIETNDITLNNPSKKGYTFVGWREKETDTPTTNFVIRKGSTGNKTLEAVYEINTYTISYDLDGGSLNESVTNPVTYNVKTDTFTLNNPSKKGYEFTGWSGTGIEETSKNVTILKGSIGNRTYTANYTPKTYTITYEGLTNEEISSLNNPTTYTIESNNISITNPNKRLDNDGDDKEIFTGWSGTGINGQTVNLTIEAGSTGNKTFTANFIDADPDIYPITYNLNGGSLGEGKTNPSSYTKKTNDFTLNNPSKKGYTFTGWSGTGIEGTSTSVTISKGSRGERNYTANYTPKTYTITYNLDDGSLGEGKTNPTSYTIETNDFTLNNPSKLGYTFLGWKEDSNDTPVSTMTILKGSTGNKTFTAVYSKTKYLITYNLNNGSLETEKTNPTHYYVDTNSITLNNPSKENYIFEGWSGTGIDGVSKNVTIETGSTGNRTYEAVFTPIEYTITYDLGEGSLEEGKTNPITYTVETEDFTLNNPIKENSKFDGWTGTDLQFKTKSVTIKKGSSGNKNFVANYGPNAYIVKFINQGSLYSSKIVNYGATVKSARSPYIDANHIFAYWSLDNKSVEDGAIQYDFSTPVTDDITLYSVFREIKSPTITHTPTDWTNQNVTVTISTEETGHKIYYRTNDTEYTEYTAPFEVSENTTVYSYSSKNSSEISLETSHEITNIDKIKPNITTLSASSLTANSFTVNVAARDDESGIASVTLYKNGSLVGNFEYEDDELSEKINSYELTNLEEGQTYIIKAVAVDKAGNISDSLEKTFTTGETVVARLVGKNNSALDSSNYVEFNSLKDAIEYDDCVSNQCTIQMVQGTSESNTILKGQDITLDLNGQIVSGISSDYTIANAGLFRVVDNSETSGVLYNSLGTSLKNIDEEAVTTLGVNDDLGEVLLDSPTIVGRTYGANKEVGTLNFYDGYVEGISAINGTVDDTPYSYNARVSSVSRNDNVVKQKAVLSIVQDAEARIGNVYYVRLKDAIDKSNVGTIDSDTRIESFVNSITTYGEYGFSYNSLINAIVPNEENILESASIIPIDLTNEEEDKILLLSYNKYSNQEIDGYIRLTEDLSTEMKTGWHVHDDTVIYQTGSSNTDDIRKSVSLTKGKTYYLILKGNVKVNEISIGKQINDSITNDENYKITNDNKQYGFEYDEETHTLRSNNNYVNGSTAFGYIEVDLTNKDTDYVLSTSTIFDTLNKSGDVAVINVTKDNLYVSPSNYSSLSYVYYTSPSGYYVPDGRTKIGPLLKTTTLTKGYKYYIQFYYIKQASNTTREAYESYGCKDEFVIKNLDIYPVNGYENISTDNLVSETSNGTSHKYIEIDMTDKTEVGTLYADFNLGQGADNFVAVTDSIDMPSVSDAYLTAEEQELRYSYIPGDYTDGTLPIRLTPGKKNYVHFVSKTSLSVNYLAINYDKVGFDPLRDFKNVTSNGYIAGPNYVRNPYQVPANTEADTYVPIDLRNESSDVIVSFNIHSLSSYPSYIYLTTNKKNVSLSSLKTDDENFIEYYESVSNNSRSLNNNNYSFYLKKGKKYYLHFGFYNNSNYTSNGTSIRNINYVRVNDHIVSIGQNNVLEGTVGPAITGTFDRDDIIVDSTSDTNARFVGSNPNNYVSFNGEKWRIIGIFNTESDDQEVAPRLKIVRDSLGVYSFDSTDKYNNNAGSGINEWSKSDLMKLLNDGYSNETGGSLFYNSESGNCYVGQNNATSPCDFTENGLKSSSKEFIDTVKWNTGAITNMSDTVKEMYEEERGNKNGKTDYNNLSYSPIDDVKRTTTWVGQIGTLYATDYLYAVDKYGSKSRANCISSLDSDCYTMSDWLWTGSVMLTMTPSNYSPYSVIIATPNGISTPAAYMNFSVMPTAYLKTNVTISGGNGSSGTPYTITLGQNKNTDPDFGLVEANGNRGGLIKDDTDDQNYRYIGANPNNFINIGNDTWRIIGIFKVQDEDGNEDYRIKVVHSSIGSYSWDSSVQDSNNGYGRNDWNYAAAMKLLNPGYTNNQVFAYNNDTALGLTNVNNSLYWNKSSGYCFNSGENRVRECSFTDTGLTDTAKEFIETIVWNTGAIPTDRSGMTELDYYNVERGNNTARTDLDSTPTGYDNLPRYSTWTGKVGLPYYSDALMASKANDGNWLAPTNNTATMNSVYGGSGSSSAFNNQYYFTYSQYGASNMRAPGQSVLKPTVYLSTKTYITGGEGTYAKPYTLELKNKVNRDTTYGLGKIEEDEDEGSASSFSVSRNTTDYTKVKNRKTYGYTYDPDLDMYMNDNYGDLNSLASSTIELDLTNETSMKEIHVKQNIQKWAFTSLVINESSEPLSYGFDNREIPICSGSHVNCNIHTTDWSFYLDGGKKYYIHMGFVGGKYYSSSSNESELSNNVHYVQIKVDKGVYTNQNTINDLTVVRNDDIDTVQVLKNINLDYTVNIIPNRSVKLDLNGYTLKSVTDKELINNSGELEIIDTKTGGKILNNNNTAIVNNLGSNLVLTSGSIETSENGVNNTGTLTMKEDFDITSSNIGINNVDGVINNLQGTITSNIGVKNTDELKLNSTNSGKILNSGNPLVINASNIGIQNFDTLNNATVNIVESNNTVHYGLLTNSENVEIKNVVVNTTNSKDVGVHAKSIKKIEDSTINGNIALQAGFNDNSVIKNVTTDSNYALELTSGNITINDNLGLSFTGGFINNGNMTIDLENKQITKSLDNHIINKKNMTINGLANNNLNILNNSTLVGSNFSANKLDAEGSANTTLTGVNLNTLKTLKHEINGEKQVATITNCNIKNIDNHDEFSSTDYTLNKTNLTITNSTIGYDNAVNNVIVNTGKISLKDSNVKGTLFNSYGGELTVDNTSVTSLTNSGKAKFNNRDIFGDTEVVIKNGSTIGNITNGSSLSVYNPEEMSERFDLITLQNSTVTGNTINKDLGKIINESSSMSTINNGNILVLGVKDGEVSKNSPSTETIANGGKVYFYDGIVRSTSEPITGFGSIEEIENNYYLNRTIEDNKNVVYLTNDLEVCKVGETPYPSIKSAIDNNEGDINIVITKSHVTADKITNSKNVVIDLNGKTIKEYSGNFITNTGTLEIKNTDGIGKIQHTNLEVDANDDGKVMPTDAIDYRNKTNINNSGTMTINNVIIGSGIINNEGTLNTTLGFTSTINNDGNLNVDGTTMLLLDNRRNSNVSNIQVAEIKNRGNIVIDSNRHDWNDKYITRFKNYNGKTYSDDEKNIWIKSGTYEKVIQVNEENVDNIDSQKIKFGDENKEVVINKNVDLEKGYVDMTNTTINNEDNAEISLRMNGTMESTISNSTIKQTASSKNSISKALTVGTYNVTINDSDISCELDSLNAYKCYAITGPSNEKIITNNTNVKGYYAYNGFAIIEIDGGTIRGDDVAIKSPGASVYVTNGTLSANGRVIDTSDTTTINNTIVIGSNKEKNVIGNPTLTSNLGVGIKATGKTNLYVANGTITSKYNAIDLDDSNISNNNYKLSINVGTISEEGKTINPTITSTDSNAIYVHSTSSSNTATIERGSINGQGSLEAGINIDGNMTITVGKDDGDMYKTNPIIEGTKYGITCTNKYSCDVNIYDGDIIGTTGNSVNANIFKVANNYIIVTEEKDSKEHTHLAQPNIARIGETEYQTLQEAVDAAGNGDIIEVILGTTLYNSTGITTIPSDKNIIIDYANNDIYSETNHDYIVNNGTLEIRNASLHEGVRIVNNGTLDYSTGSSSGLIENNGTLTVTAPLTTLYNNINGTADIYNEHVDTVTSAGTLNLHSGSISTLTSTGTTELSEGTISLLVENSGTVINNESTIEKLDINDGTFNMLGGSVSDDLVLKDGTLNIGTKDGNVSGESPIINNIIITGTGLINLYDGYIEGNNAGDNQSGTIQEDNYPIRSTENRNFINEVETGYTAVSSGNRIELQENPDVVTNTTKGVSYKNMKSAIDAASSGDTLQLIYGIVPTSINDEINISSGKELTIDFNNTFGFLTKNNYITNNGTVHFITTVPEFTYIPVYYMGAVNNGTLEVTQVTVDEFYLDNNSGSTATLSIDSNKFTSVNDGDLTINDPMIDKEINITNNWNFNYNNEFMFAGENQLVTTIINTASANINNLASNQLIIDNTGNVIMNGGTIDNLTISNSENSEINIYNSAVKNSEITNSGTINVNYGNFNFTGTNSGELNISNIGEYDKQVISPDQPIIIGPTLGMESTNRASKLLADISGPSIAPSADPIVVGPGNSGDKFDNDFSLVNNGGTVTIENSSLSVKSINNYENSIINFNSGTMIPNNDITGYTNNGTINYQGLIVHSDMNIENGIFSITNNGTLAFTAGNHQDLDITGTGSTSISDTKFDSTMFEQNTIELTNSTVSYIKATNSASINNSKVTSNFEITGSEVSITNNSEVQDINVSASNITVDSSSISNIYAGLHANNNIIINATYSSIGTINNSNLMLTGNSNNNIADISLTMSNTNITGESLNVKNITANGGSINASVTKSNLNNYKDDVNYCEFTNVSITGDVTCNYAKFDNTSVTGNITSTYENSNHPNLDDIGISLVDSTVTGVINSTKLYMENTTVNGYVSVHKIGSYPDETSGEATIKSGKVISEDNTIVGVSADKLILGIDDDTIDNELVEIKGANTAVNSNEIYYYDGTLTGNNEAINGIVKRVAPSYKIDITSVNGKEVMTLVQLSLEEVVADTNNKFFQDFQAAINDCPDGGIVKLHRDVTLDEDVIISDKTIIIDLDGHRIENDEHLIGDYSYMDSANPSVSGALSRFLANVTGSVINPMDIIVYQMNDGSSLDSSKIYKVFKIEDNGSTIVRFKENEIGNYDLGNETTDLRTINGKIYINGIGEGNYRLISSDNKEIIFTVSKDNFSSNIGKNLNTRKGNYVSETIATLILSLQTGVIRIPYIIIITSILTIVIYLLINKKRKVN